MFIAWREESKAHGVRQKKTFTKLAKIFFFCHFERLYRKKIFFPIDRPLGTFDFGRKKILPQTCSGFTHCCVTFSKKKIPLVALWEFLILDEKIFSPKLVPNLVFAILSDFLEKKIPFKILPPENFWFRAKKPFSPKTWPKSFFC